MEKIIRSQPSLTNIPEIITPGVTIPIYDEDIKSLNSQDDQPNKLGSYRAKTGKISNTLSNLLPSISAKLHHSKKKGSSKSDTDTQSNASSSDVLVDLKDLQNTLPKASNINYANFTIKNANGENVTKMTSISGTPIGTGESILSSQDLDSLSNFPDATSFFLDPPRKSTESYGLENLILPRVSRSRNNTISSQITAMSSVIPQTAPSSTIWTTNVSNIESSQHPSTLQSFNNSNSNIAGAANAYFDPSLNTSNNNLTVPQSGWNNTASNPTNFAVNTNRPRTKSNASSIYLDALTYDQSIKSRAPSIYSTGQPSLTSQQAQQYMMPLVADDIDPVSINWVTMDPSVPAINQIANLLPTNTISISNVFSLQQHHQNLANAINLTSTSLVTLCSKFGEVVSARTLVGINIALVEFTNVEGAMRALEALQGKEVSMVGAPSTVSFAKILPMHQQQMMIPTNVNNKMPIMNDNINQPLLQEQLYNGLVSFQQQGNLPSSSFNHKMYQNQSHHNSNNYNSNHSSSHTPSTHDRESCPFSLPPLSFRDQEEALAQMIKSFGVEYDSSQTKHIIDTALNIEISTNTNDFGPLPEHVATKEFDAPKLRELRKMIDANQLSELEIEQLAMVMLDELPELCSDYLGNTIAQKLFEHSSDIIRTIMLRKTSRYLSSMGVHKNGTWACQKIISMAVTPKQYQLVASGVRQHCISLFNDQFGNYVIQCVLKFGFPWNNFIFENILANFWVIVQSRYGARAVRACLEATDVVTFEQTLILSATIIVYADYLTTNSNGTLLVTWFLDTCTLPNRYRTLANKLAKNITKLACHKLASLTILKVLNYRGDDDSRNIILTTLFGDENNEEPPEILVKILSDNTCGPSFIYKVLSMTNLDEDSRSHVIDLVRKVILKSNVAHHHRRLMEEVGLTSMTTQSPNPTMRGHTNSTASHSQDMTNHMRQVSASSALSNNSHPSMSMNIPQPAHNNNINGASSMNYSGVFPMSFGTSTMNNNPINNSRFYPGIDDLPSQFDTLSMSNKQPVKTVNSMSFTPSGMSAAQQYPMQPGNEDSF